MSKAPEIMSLYPFRDSELAGLAKPRRRRYQRLQETTVVLPPRHSASVLDEACSSGTECTARVLFRSTRKLDRQGLTLGASQE